MSETDERTIAAVMARLAEPFAPECIEWLPKVVRPPKDTNARGYGVTTALALSYIDARSVMARLDEVLGAENWKDSYRFDANRTICNLALRLNGEWIGKEDGSGDTNFEAEKGGISGAFKRAAVKWGVGRYLYDVPEVHAECEGRVFEKQGKKQVSFGGWTAKGTKQLADALASPPGPRSTGKPSSIEALLDSVERATDVKMLREIFDRSWEGVPLEYRAEVSRAFTARRRALGDTTMDKAAAEKETANG